MERVVLFHGPGRPLEMAQYQAPDPQGAELVVRVLCCTICASDVHTFTGRRSEATPTVLGHEVVGRVEAFGPEAAHHDFRGGSLAVGKLVRWGVTAAAGPWFSRPHGLPHEGARLLTWRRARVV